MQAVSKAFTSDPAAARFHEGSRAWRVRTSGPMVGSPAEPRVPADAVLRGEALLRGGSQAPRVACRVPGSVWTGAEQMREGRGLGFEPVPPADPTACPGSVRSDHCGRVGVRQSAKGARREGGDHALPGEAIEGRDDITPQPIVMTISGTRHGNRPSLADKKLDLLGTATFGVGSIGFE